MNERSTAAIPMDPASQLADLIDLLQLEFDALPTYAAAIAALRRPAFRDALQGYKAEHLRHVRALSTEIEALGGVPLPFPHLPTGLFKLAVQLLGLPGGDRAILLAFVSNEWQSREKYARYAARPYPPRLAALLRQHADDEARHYDWACAALEELGCGEATPLGQASRLFARFHGTTADALESVGRAGVEASVRMLRPA